MPGDSASLEQLLANPKVWRGRGRSSQRCGLSSGYEILDRHLPEGGWPQQALTEILIEDYGIGELKLLMPALAVAKEKLKDYDVTTVDLTEGKKPIPNGLAILGLE